MRNDKPLRDTPQYIQWINSKIMQAAEEFDVPILEVKRDSFARLFKGQVKHSDLKHWKETRERAHRYLQIPVSGPTGEGDLPLQAVPEGYHVKQISTQLGDDGEVQKQWLKAPLEHATGSLTDALPEGHEISGVSTLVSGDGQTTLQWIKTKKSEESREEILARLMQDLPDHIKPRKGKTKAPKGAVSKDLLAVYPLGDPHIGMLSWEPETGDSFDLNKARKITCDAINDLVTRGPRTEKALVVNLGDFFHSDNDSNRTARAGNALDVDGRWTKVLQAGLKIMVYLVDQVLIHHKEVYVINEIGNHDDHSAIFLSVALDSYYRNEPRVTVDLSPARRHWYRFGKNLIGVTHGHNQKHGDLESIMAAEKPKDWGETIHRFWYCGHIHHMVKKEMRGCVIESFRTLAPRDAYAATVGYKAGRDMNRITLHREYGEIGREIVNAAYLKAMYGNGR